MTLTTKRGAPADCASQEAALPAELAARWDEARRLYPIYAGLAKQFDLGLAPCRELESASDRPAPEAIARALRWLDEMDKRIPVHQLRQFLQTSQKTTEENLRALTLRHLNKQNKIATDRDKIDLLLVQYFALGAPEKAYREKLDLPVVAEVLKLVLGEMDVCPLDWFEPLNKILEELDQCQSLRDSVERGLFEQGRRLKESAGNMFYDPSALVAFTRFNFLLRRSLIRLMHEDLRAIREGLAQLESRGIQAVDCHRAGLSSEESLGTLLEICKNWKQPFGTNYSEYSAGPAFQRLLAIRAAVEEALTPPRTAPEAQRSDSRGESHGALPAKRAAPPEATPTFPTPESALAREKGSPPLGQRREAATSRETSPSRCAATEEAARSAGNDAAPAASAEISSAAAAPNDLESCQEMIWEQLIAAPPGRGRSMTTIVLHDTKLLLFPWEVTAFVSEGGQVSNDLRRAVVARALVAVAMDGCKRSGNYAQLDGALALAHAEVAYLQGRVDQAKHAKNTDAAVNLGISAKRLLAFIEEAINLRA